MNLALDQRVSDEAYASWGPFQLLREAGVVELSPAHVARRFVSIHGVKSTSHMVYVLGERFDRSLRRRLDGTEPVLMSLKSPHLLQYQVVGTCIRRGSCIATPYPGDHCGLVTLRKLRDLKGGVMTQGEAFRCIEHLLSGLERLHQAGITDGGVELDRALVDRRGCVLLELPGLPNLVIPDERTFADRCKADVRGVAKIAFELLRGHSASSGTSDQIAAAPQSAWDLWLSHALDPLEGFATADDARELLPESTVDIQPSVVGRFVGWMGQRSRLLTDSRSNRSDA